MSDLEKFYNSCLVHEITLLSSVGSFYIINMSCIRKIYYIYSSVFIYSFIHQECYGDIALFCHDSYGGNVIGVLWKPKTTADKALTVS